MEWREKRKREKEREKKKREERGERGGVGITTSKKMTKMLSRRNP